MTVTKNKEGEQALYPVELDGSKDPPEQPDHGKRMQCRRSCQPCALIKDELKADGMEQDRL